MNNSCEEIPLTKRNGREAEAQRKGEMTVKTLDQELVIAKVAGEDKPWRCDKVFSR